MKKVLLALKTNPLRMFEVTSESELPEWFVRRVVWEVYAESVLSNRGSLSMTVSGKALPLKYVSKLPLIKLFIPNSKELDIAETLSSFSDFLRENDVAPHNIKLTAKIKTNNPERTFAELTGKFEDLMNLLEKVYGSKPDVKPNISYEGDDYSMEFSLPLDDKASSILGRWAQQNHFNRSVEPAPLEEKSD